MFLKISHSLCSVSVYKWGIVTRRYQLPLNCIFIVWCIFKFIYLGACDLFRTLWFITQHFDTCTIIKYKKTEGNEKFSMYLFSILLCDVNVQLCYVRTSCFYVHLTTLNIVCLWKMLVAILRNLNKTGFFNFPPLPSAIIS